MTETAALSLQWRHTVLTSDVAAVTNLVRATGVFTEEEIECAGSLVNDALTNGLDAGYHFIFADFNGQVVGYCCYGQIPLTDHSYDLYWIAVHPQYQHDGIGKTLLHHCEQAIQILHGKQIYIETSGRVNYLPAQQFYNKHGYATLLVLNDFYRDGDDKIMYRKLLRN